MCTILHYATMRVIEDSVPFHGPHGCAKVAGPNNAPPASQGTVPLSADGVVGACLKHGISGSPPGKRSPYTPGEGSICPTCSRSAIAEQLVTANKSVWHPWLKCTQWCKTACSTYNTLRQRYSEICKVLPGLGSSHFRAAGRSANSEHIMMVSPLLRTTWICSALRFFVKLSTSAFWCVATEMSYWSSAKLSIADFT